MHQDILSLRYGGKASNLLFLLVSCCLLSFSFPEENYDILDVK